MSTPWIAALSTRWAVRSEFARLAVASRLLSVTACIDRGLLLLGIGVLGAFDVFYENRSCGMVIRGSGRYKRHRPLRQSTFEFWSDDRRSPIRRGVGLWRYLPRRDGSVELAA